MRKVRWYFEMDEITDSGHVSQVQLANPKKKKKIMCRKSPMGIFTGDWGFGLGTS
jgi:hypothetical protein